MKTYQYKEGPNAKSKFEEGMKALFQVPKDAVPQKKKPAKKRAKKSDLIPQKENTEGNQ